MVQHHGHPGSLVPQETSFDNADNPGIAQPYSQSEIEDLLFGEDRPIAERIARLQEMRAEVRERSSGDFGGRDLISMLDEIDRAIEELQRDLTHAEENGGLDAALAMDPADHLDALAPDDVEAREALIGEEQFYEDDEDGPVDDDHAWAGSDEFRHDMH
ncbi:MAG: hypothetical protein ABS75_00815 [Pelagibacterium sp. SCN 63-23]|nr:MAG: hypothetical protein ABS75_00815 [Pelagibacterium sp. SCN 63-23]